MHGLMSFFSGLRNKEIIMEYMYIIYLIGSFLSAVSLTIISTAIGMILQDRKVDKTPQITNEQYDVVDRVLAFSFIVFFILTILFASMAGMSV